MEILKQIAENSVLVLSLAEINSGVEVDSTEHVAELLAVVIFDLGKGNIYLLTDLIIGAVVVEIIESGSLSQCETLIAHSTFNTSFVALVFLDILSFSLVVNVIQILDKEHGEYVVLVT